MKIWISEYILGIRKAVLIKIQTDEIECGYGDCHPWTSLGDESLEFQIKALKNGIFTNLMERSVYFAQIDGRARSEKKSLLKNLPKVLNHKTFFSVSQINEEVLTNTLTLGFKKIKIKLSARYKEDLKKIILLKSLDKIKLRLDFNGKFGDDALEYIQQNIPEILEKKMIDWIEDPVPYKKDVWQKIYENYQVPLAYDHPRQCEIPEAPYCQIRVVKPAKLICPVNTFTPVIYTHYLDHELGRRQAYWQGHQDLKFDSKYEWGFLPDDWSKGPEFGYQDDDIGFGMTEYLSKLNWTSVI